MSKICQLKLVIRTTSMTSFWQEKTCFQGCHRQKSSSQTLAIISQKVVTLKLSLWQFWWQMCKYCWQCISSWSCRKTNNLTRLEKVCHFLKTFIGKPILMPMGHFHISPGFLRLATSGKYLGRTTGKGHHETWWNRMSPCDSNIVHF